MYNPLQTDDRNQWEWVDGSPSGYRRWDLFQPDGQGFCGRLALNWDWYDAPCNVASNFVCNVGGASMYICLYIVFLELKNIFYFIENS